MKTGLPCINNSLICQIHSYVSNVHSTNIRFSNQETYWQITIELPDPSLLEEDKPEDVLQDSQRLGFFNPSDLGRASVQTADLVLVMFYGLALHVLLKFQFLDPGSS